MPKLHLKGVSRLEHSAATLQRNAITIRRCGRCCCNILPVLFAAPTDPPCCRFSSAYQRMLRYTARASSDVFLCSQPANSRMCPHQEQPRTIDRSQRAASSRQCAPSCPSLNVGASRTSWLCSDVSLRQNPESVQGIGHRKACT